MCQNIYLSVNTATVCRYTIHIHIIHASTSIDDLQKQSSRRRLYVLIHFMPQNTKHILLCRLLSVQCSVHSVHLRHTKLPYATQHYVFFSCIFIGQCTLNYRQLRFGHEHYTAIPLLCRVFGKRKKKKKTRRKKTFMKCTGTEIH